MQKFQQIFRQLNVNKIKLESNIYTSKRFEKNIDLNQNIIKNLYKQGTKFNFTDYIFEKDTQKNNTYFDSLLRYSNLIQVRY
jgi:hypothetical protein